MPDIGGGMSWWPGPGSGQWQGIGAWRHGSAPLGANQDALVMNVEAARDAGMAWGKPHKRAFQSQCPLAASKRTFRGIMSALPRKADIRKAVAARLLMTQSGHGPAF